MTETDRITCCAVILLTNSMGVEGSTGSEEIIKVVERAGYGASLKGAQKAAKTDSAEVSHVRGTAKIVLNGQFEEESVRRAVEDADCGYPGME